MSDLILSIDQGTTGSTATVCNSKLEILATADQDFQQHFPRPTWVEHDPQEIASSVVSTIRAVTSKVDPKKIACIGITNQRETIFFWERGTTNAFGNAIVWQDRRTSEICAKLKSRGLESDFQKKTGLVLDPYFSGTKVAWALENNANIKKASRDNRLAVGTSDSFLISLLSDGKTHVTESSNACRTLAFDIHKNQFDPELCKHLGVPVEVWPEVKHSAGVFAKTKNFPGLPDGIPITGALGDQQSALMGQACLRPGMAKCTYGTGAFLLMNAGDQPTLSSHGLLTTIAWNLKGKLTYAFEGSAFIAGAAIQWLRDGLGVIPSASEIESLASQVSTTDGVFFVPALSGLGAPHWDPQARGVILGLTRGTTKAHLARASLEGIAFQNTELLRAMESDLKGELKNLRVDGGASQNNLLMQIQSDLLGCTISRPKIIETTSLGAIFAAGLGFGIWSSLDEIEKSWKLDREFSPAVTQSHRAARMDQWKKAVSASREFGATGLS